MPTRDSFSPQRRSIRLSDYDYTQKGAYFVTVCTLNRECVLGEIVDDEMQINAAGLLVAQTWDRLSLRFPSIELDALVVMPNHVHGIVVLTTVSPPPTPPDLVGAGLALPEINIPERKKDDQKPGTPRGAPTLGDVVGAFKSLSARACNQTLNRAGQRFWQRNYHEHIIRNEADLARIREYIATNPARWTEDNENPAFVRKEQDKRT